MFAGKKRQMKCIFFVYITGTLLLGTAFMTYAQSSAVKAVVGFEKQIVNASEGNVAVVCVTSLFISSTLSTPVTVNVSLMNFSSQSSAAGNAKMIGAEPENA